MPDCPPDPTEEDQGHALLTRFLEMKGAILYCYLGHKCDRQFSTGSRNDAPSTSARICQRKENASNEKAKNRPCVGKPGFARCAPPDGQVDAAVLCLSSRTRCRPNP